MATNTAVDVVMPQMGVSVSEGTVTRWAKQVGDTVEADETLLEISTDKVDTEVPSPASGVVSEILVQEGETVEVGTLLARVGGEAGGAAEHGIDPTTVPGTGDGGRVTKKDIQAFIEAGAPAAPAPSQAPPAPEQPTPVAAPAPSPAPALSRPEPQAPALETAAGAGEKL